MDKVLDAITNLISADKESDEVEIIRYGVEIIFLKGIFWVTLLVAGLLFCCFWECLIFLLMFSSLRTYAGGYHTESRLKCFIYSLCTVCISLTIVKLFANPIVLWISYVLVVPIIFIVFRVSPVDTENKRLDDDEKRRFKKISVLILFIEIAVSIIFSAFGFICFSLAANLAIISSGVLLLCGHIKNLKNN